jgi:hypothetical protein
MGSSPPFLIPIRRRRRHLQDDRNDLEEGEERHSIFLSLTNAAADATGRFP